MIAPHLLYGVTALALLLIGLAAVLVKRNLIKTLVGLILLNAGAPLLVVTLGRVSGPEGATAVDPTSQAMALALILLGFGAVAFISAVIIRVYARLGTLDINAIARLKW